MSFLARFSLKSVSFNCLRPASEKTGHFQKKNHEKGNPKIALLTLVEWVSKSEKSRKPVLVCMVFVFCVLCIIVYCAEKFWDPYTKMRDSVIFRPKFDIPWSEHFGWFSPWKTWIFTNRMNEIRPYFVVWQSSYKTQFCKNASKTFFGRETI